METAIIETTSTETGPEVKAPAQPETQSQQETTPQFQPDEGVSPELGNGVPDKPNNVEKVETDGNLKSSIDGKTPEGLGSKEEWLHTLLDREKENPGVEFNEDELDVLDEYYEGRIQPKKPKPKDEKESDEETKPEEKSEEEEPPKEDEDPVEAVLKEVGAKSKKELLKKVKDLRKVVSGKVTASEEYKELKNQTTQINKKFENELALMNDVRAGVPEAIQHLEKAYGITVVKPGKPETKQKPEVETNDSSEDEFLDEIAGKKITNLERTVAKLTQQLEKVNGSNQKIQEKFAEERAEAQIVDEMVAVAERVPTLKSIPTLRKAIKAWREGKPDTRLDGFQNLFKLANEKHVDLMTAHEILAGRNASLEIEKAKLAAKKEVYEQKPTRSLSDLQGRGVDNKPSYSDSQVEQMINEGNLPEEWFDANDQPNAQTIPRKYLKLFFAPQELGS